MNNKIKNMTMWFIALAGLIMTTNAAQAADYDLKHDGLFYKIIGVGPADLSYVAVVPEKADYPYYSSEANKPKGDVTIPKSFTQKLGPQTFFYFVTEIGDNAFYDCDALTSVDIPNSVTKIGKQAFRGCYDLTSVTIPNSVTTIDNWAFSFCTTLPSVDIPKSVTTIGEEAFESCDALKTVTVHWDKPLAIKANVFQSVDISKVTLKVPKGKEAAYKKAPVWKDFKIEEPKDYDFEDDGLYYKVTAMFPSSNAKVVPEKADFPYYNAGNKPTGNVTIPNGVKSGLAIYTVTEIGDNAFYDCDALTSVDIPNSVTKIGKQAFRGCYDLTSVTIPNSVTTIDNWAFCFCTTLPSVDIPNSVTTIGEEAFESCDALKTVTVHWDKPLAIKANVFQGVEISKVTLKVPKGKAAAYKAAPVWKKFKIDDGTPPVVSVTGVTLSPTSLSLSPGETQTLTATVQPAGATDKTVTWSSSNPAIASVDGSGTVTAHKKGNAVITVKTNDGGFTATCNVTVKDGIKSVTSVALVPNALSLSPDGTRTLTATVQPASATNKTVTWSSSNTTIASVDASGTVTAHKKGNAVITVKTNDGGFTATCNVTVKDGIKSVTSVALDQHTLNLNKVKTYKLNATVLPGDATDKTLTWTSSDPSVATVDGTGLVTIIAKGTTVITASANDGSGKSAQCTVTVLSTVANQTLEGIKVWTADGRLFLTLPAPQTVRIYNVSGALVKELALPAGDTSHPLPAGFYIVQLGTQVKKVIVK